MKRLLPIILLLVMLAVGGAVPAAAQGPDCPDGTIGDDTLNCEVDPPTATNPDTNIDAGDGDDIINLFPGVTVNNILGEGGNDTITLQGTVNGVVYGGFGADMVVLKDGANGGADNIMLLDGHDGSYDDTGDFDILDFDFTGLTQEQIDQLIYYSSPYAGEITINGQTYQWGNFDQLKVNGDGVLPVGCADGTNAGEDIICHSASIPGMLDGGAGDDHIIVTASGGITGPDFEDGVAGDSVNDDFGTAAGNDIIEFYGAVFQLSGDYVIDTDGGDDQITVYGEVYGYLYGDYIHLDIQNTVQAGNDSIIVWPNPFDEPDSIQYPHQINGDGIFGTFTENTVVTGGDDVIEYHGLLGPEAVDIGNDIANDPYTPMLVLSGLFNIAGGVGSDTITNFGHAYVLTGDGVTEAPDAGLENPDCEFVGDDIITNEGNLYADIFGDNWCYLPSRVSNQSAADTIINNGEMYGTIWADFVFFSDPPEDLTGYPLESGQPDIITNTGTIHRSIYSDSVTYDPANTEDYIPVFLLVGGDDIVTNSGAVDLGIYTGAGDDTVILQDGSNGGDDNLMTLDGGTGIDTLNFDMTGLTAQDVYNIAVQNPASGQVTINGQTYQWTNFETIIVNGQVPTALQPNGLTFSAVPVYPTFTWAEVGGATWYRLYVRRAGTNSVLIDQAIQDDGSLCDIDGCQMESIDYLPRWGLVDGNYEWWLGAWGPQIGWVWSSMAVFTVDVPAPALPDPITVDPGEGRITITFADDPNTLWVQVWVGPHPSGAYNQWHERDGAGKAFTCAAGLCTVQPAWDVLAAGEMKAWLRSWGPGGYSSGGIDASGQWNSSAAFNLPNIPPAAPIDMAASSEVDPTFTWSASDYATWYQVMVTKEGSGVLHNQWHLGADIGCPTDADTCMLGGLGLDAGLVAGTTQNKIWVRAWGPGGMSTGSVDGQWEFAEFAYNPE